MKYVLIGADGIYGEKLRKNPYVEWKHQLRHEDVMRLMRNCSIYVQNSQFETFGLAPIEALFSGANVLLSLNMGCCDLFDCLDDADVICNNDDTEEIARKMRMLFKTGNNLRLRKSFHKEFISTEYQRKLLGMIISEL